MFDLLVKNGLLINHNEKQHASICIKGSKIVEITTETSVEAAKTIDAEGCLVMPGFIDPHAHLNDPPGGDVSEDFYTGTCSAAAGGITTVIEMPLTTPVVSTEKAFKDKRRICESKAVVDFAMYGACTPDNALERFKILARGAIGFKAFMCYSSEIQRLDDAALWRAMESFAREGVLLCLHCENADMISTFTAELTSSGRTSPMDYCEAHPPISELEAVQRASLFAYKTGAKVHICHCGLGEAADAADHYRSLGADLTLETCPHYLTLNEEDVRRFGVYCICNPPIRSQAVQDGLWERVLQGKIDFIGTDHSAYLHGEKAEGKEDIFRTPPGITAMQLCFPLFYDQAVNKRGLPAERFVEMASTAAAKRYGLFPRKGSIRVGADADLVILDPNEKWTVKEEDLFYLEKWTLHKGWEITGRIKETLVRGNTVFRHGKITAEPGYGIFIASGDREESI